MKVELISILWHDQKAPILSVDFQPNSDRFATGGADSDVKIWRFDELNDEELKKDIKKENKQSNVEQSTRITYLASLNIGHEKPVNVVRFSPDGVFLASGCDGGKINIYKYDPTRMPNDDDVEYWGLQCVLKTASNGVYDLAWSPSGDYIIAGMIDNNAVVFNTQNGSQVCSFKEHQHYVQGVAWHPLGRFFATMSADKSVRVYDALCANALISDKIEESIDTKNETNNSSTLNEKKEKRPKVEFKLSKVINSISKPITYYDDQNKTNDQNDENVKSGQASLFLFEGHSGISFFRRLTWTPDGSLLLCPAGVIHNDDTPNDNTNTENKENNNANDISNGSLKSEPSDEDHDMIVDEETTNEEYCLWAFDSNDMKNPVYQTPFPNKPPVVVRCCRSLFALWPSSESDSDSIVNLRHRMLYSVATLDEVALFDTQSQIPFAVLKGQHYSSIHDTAWRDDGRALIIASADGFCTAVRLSEEEVGKPLKNDEIEENLANALTFARISRLDGIERKKAAAREARLANKSATSNNDTTNDMDVVEQTTTTNNNNNNNNNNVKSEQNNDKSDVPSKRRIEPVDISVKTEAPRRVTPVDVVKPE